MIVGPTRRAFAVTESVRSLIVSVRWIMHKGHYLGTMGVHFMCLAMSVIENILATMMTRQEGSEPKWRAGYHRRFSERCGLPRGHFGTKRKPKGAPIKWLGVYAQKLQKKDQRIGVQLLFFERDVATPKIGIFGRILASIRSYCVRTWQTKALFGSFVHSKCNGSVHFTQKCPFLLLLAGTSSVFLWAPCVRLSSCGV